MKSILLIFWFFSRALLAAESDVMQGFSQVNAHQQAIHMGKCGAGEVIAAGLDAPLSEVGLSLAQILLINADGVVTRISKDRHNPYADVISDFTGIACEPSQGGRLLIYSECMGSGCGEGFQFHIFSMRTGQLMAQSCNAQCASRLLSSNLPLRIQATNQ